MDLRTSILIYFALVIIIFILARTVFRIRIWSSIVLAVIIAIIAASAICPMSSVDKAMDGSPLLTLYMLIYVVTIVLILLYVLDKAALDKY